MPTCGDHKIVRSRVLEYVQAIGRTFVSRAEVERRRGFDPDMLAKSRAKGPLALLRRHARR
jgi:hypothetical protein